MIADFDKKVDEIIDRLVAQIETMISKKADKSIIESTITQSVGALRDELLKKDKYTNDRINDLEQRIIALEKSTCTRAVQAPAHVPAPTSVLKSNSVQIGGTVVTTRVDLSEVIGLTSNALYYEWVQKILEKISSNEELKNELNVNIPERIKNLKNQPNFAENFFLILLCVYYKAHTDNSGSKTKYPEINEKFINKIKNQCSDLTSLSSDFVQKLYKTDSSNNQLHDYYDDIVTQTCTSLRMGTAPTLRPKLQNYAYPAT